MNTPDILKQILAHKIDELAACAQAVSLQALSRQVESAPPVRPFGQALEVAIAEGRPAVIAELKKASPSRGILREDFDPAAIAASYERAGATCLSVLTDTRFFQGAPVYLQAARNACKLPVLRKDFIIDPYQVYESRVMGADCVLLIAAALGDPSLRALAELACELGMDVLLEVHDAQELERALAVGVRLIGINNRDLRTFKTHLETTLELLAQVEVGRVVITESGIHDRNDVHRLRQHGVHAFLVGETLMRAPNPGAKLAELFEID